MHGYRCRRHFCILSIWDAAHCQWRCPASKDCEAFVAGEVAGWPDEKEDGNG